MRFDRRSFLKGAALTGAGLLGGQALLDSREAHAWAPRPDDLLPSDPHYKVLEIFLYGGLSPWETFYVREDGVYSDWFGWRETFEGLSWCGDVPSAETLTTFGSDANGHPVFLGPCLRPLWGYKNRLRVLPVRHNLKPHEGAIPLALTGLRLGNPRLAGLGAHIQRHARDAFPLTTSQPRSYVLFPPASEIFDESRLVAMTATGMHPGTARPLFLRIADDPTEAAAFLTALDRGNVDGEHDRLVDVYRDQYRRALRWGGPDIDPSLQTDTLTRSPGFAAYNAAVDALLHPDDISGFLDSPSLLTATTASGCTTGSFSGFNFTGRGLALASHLFNNGARYVGLLDVGLVRIPSGGGYDTHQAGHHGSQLPFNLHSTLRSLKGLIDKGFIDLDTTMVVLNTEFGRTPLPDGGGGRDHHPEGYTMALLGGPIGRTVGSTARPNRGVAGAMDDDGLTVEFAGGEAVGLTPTDVVGAVLLAAGINPRAPEAFGASEFSAAIRDGGDADRTAMVNLASKVLGIGGVS